MTPRVPRVESNSSRPRTLHRLKVRWHNPGHFLDSPPWSVLQLASSPTSILARHAILLVLIDPANGDAAVLCDEANELLRDVLGVVVLAEGVDVRVDDLLGGLTARG